jgi:hypothetical protein
VSAGVKFAAGHPKKTTNSGSRRSSIINLEISERIMLAGKNWKDFQSCFILYPQDTCGDSILEAVVTSVIPLCCEDIIQNYSRKCTVLTILADCYATRFHGKKI